MRRFVLLAPLLVAVVIGMGVVGRGNSVTLAREGTPSAGDMAPVTCGNVGGVRSSDQLVFGR